jgi:quercetin dioxygenase-like cupin family protein
MEIKRKGSQPSNKGPVDWFTGNVRIEPLFEAREYVVAGDRRIDREAAGEAASDRAITSQPADVRGASVTFEPGARTAWHTHPLGQTLMVTSGLGGRRVGVVRSRKSGPAMWSGLRLTRNIGTALRRRPR